MSVISPTSNRLIKISSFQPLLASSICLFIPAVIPPHCLQNSLPTTNIFLTAPTFSYHGYPLSLLNLIHSLYMATYSSRAFMHISSLFITPVPSPPSTYPPDLITFCRSVRVRFTYERASEITQIRICYAELYNKRFTRFLSLVIRFI